MDNMNSAGYNMDKENLLIIILEHDTHFTCKIVQDKLAFAEHRRTESFNYGDISKDMFELYEIPHTLIDKDIVVAFEIDGCYSFYAKGKEPDPFNIVIEHMQREGAREKVLEYLLMSKLEMLPHRTRQRVGYCGTHYGLLSDLVKSF